MSRGPLRQARIVDLYEQQLVDDDTAQTIREAGRIYTVGTLERIAVSGERMAQRAAVFSLGYLADYGSNRVLGELLRDSDRGVRTLAETGIREVWYRQGTPSQRRRLKTIAERGESKEYLNAVRRASRLVHDCPWFAQAWYLRGLAHFHLGDHDASIADFEQTLEINAYHFLAAAGIGHAYLKRGNRAVALQAFRRALRLNPGMEQVRAQVVYLTRRMGEGSTDTPAE